MLGAACSYCGQTQPTDTPCHACGKAADLELYQRQRAFSDRLYQRVDLDRRRGRTVDAVFANPRYLAECKVADGATFNDVRVVADVNMPHGDVYPFDSAGIQALDDGRAIESDYRYEWVQGDGLAFLRDWSVGS